MTSSYSSYLATKPVVPLFTSTLAVDSLVIVLHFLRTLTARELVHLLTAPTTHTILTTPTTHTLLTAPTIYTILTLYSIV